MSRFSNPYASTLPARPDLEQQRTRAKELLKAVRAGDEAALRRLRWSHPRLAQAELADLPGLAKLADAQWVVARELGFSSWPALKAHIDALNDGALTGASRRHRPFETDPQYYADRAEGLASVRLTGERGALRIIQRIHPRFRDASEAEVAAADFSQADAELVIAREHGFDDFAALSRHLEALKAGRAAEPFRDAFEAIKAGDLTALDALLDAHPTLVNAQGTNGNNLLSFALYFARDDMIDSLLRRGVDLSVANNKGSNPLHLVAGGGDQAGGLARLDRLIAAGAPVEAEAYGEGGTPLAMALFWGKNELAERLAREGVTPLNLRVAAGLGRVALMQALTGPDGQLLPEAGRAREFHRPHSGFPPWRPADDAQQILDEALTYAARGGHIAAMDWLVAHGAGVNAEPYNGSPLNWAVRGDRPEAVDWLVAHGADVDKPSGFGGVSSITPLQNAAAWGGRPEIARRLLRAGADPHLKDPVFDSPPAGWARFHGSSEVEKVLEDWGR